MRLKELLQWQEIAGQPMGVNDITLIPQSLVLIVRLPQGAYVWQRPTAVSAMVVGQLLAGVSLGISEIVGFPLLALIGIGMTAVLLRNLSEAATVQVAHA